MSDPAIEQLEAELRESRFKAWDVETFLANRHQAKIDALTKPKSRWKQGWQVAKELTFGLFAVIGYFSAMTIAGAWLLTGEFPLKRGMLDDRDDFCVVTPAPVVVIGD